MSPIIYRKRHEAHFNALQMLLFYLGNTVYLQRSIHSFMFFGLFRIVFQRPSWPGSSTRLSLPGAMPSLPSRSNTVLTKLVDVHWDHSTSDSPKDVLLTDTL